MLAGTPEEEQALATLGSVEPALASALAACLREGGSANLRQLLRALRELRAGRPVEPPRCEPLPDPLPHDWRAEPGERVGLLLYRSLRQAGDWSWWRRPWRPCGTRAWRRGPSG